VVPGAAQKRMPETMPMPHPMPPPEGPLLVPTGRVTASSPPPHGTQWQPLESERAVTIGRPQPID
jgi:hypothetical protein